MADFEIFLARVYDPPEAMTGARLLVDRLWPRGVSKAHLQLDDWPKDVTPSTTLRQWFHADPSRWTEFRDRYETELAANSGAVEHCLSWCRRSPVTLLTAAHDRDHNHAVVLRDWLQARL
ncbi:DUF488 domain-containing protein [Pseudogemmobacter humi]|uniref:Uncharacterized protein n=1 Tax=Pseudogemmobacter humi TaxID=2483812 RepID=A0A3P5Y001_9RHOB|nr:DUF488 family protein [Pseudogemmobacter humi]VDC33777.1 hypothetical protein XINFAN_04024 [Pseudogemmobacter humi]